MTPEHVCDHLEHDPTLSDVGAGAAAHAAAGGAPRRLWGASLRPWSALGVITKLTMVCIKYAYYSDATLHKQMSLGPNYLVTKDRCSWNGSGCRPFTVENGSGALRYSLGFYIRMRNTGN